MDDKFALLDYVENKEQIPIAFKILKKAPDFIWDWYIKKFNPLLVERIDFDIADGFSIKLPIERDVPKNIDLSVRKTIASFPQVKIVRALKNYSFENYDTIKVAHGNFLFAFLAMQIIKKFCSVTNKKLELVEVFILDANQTITQILIDSIYPHVNYLSVITGQKDFYLQKQHDIFIDNGLNLQLLNYNKSLMVNADIIINTGIENNFVYAIKPKAIYFDLSGINSIADIKIKRPDIFISDNFNLYYSEKLIDIVLLEMIFYCAFNDFKKIFNGQYNSNLFSSVSNKINNSNIKISSFQNSFKDLLEATA